MTPTEFPQQNDILNPSKGTEDTVLPLHILRTTELLGDSICPKIVSAWKPTEEEIRLISEGGLVYFHCYGYTHPPIWINATSQGLEA